MDHIYQDTTYSKPRRVGAELSQTFQSEPKGREAEDSTHSVGGDGLGRLMFNNPRAAGLERGPIIKIRTMFPKEGNTGKIQAYDSIWIQLSSSSGYLQVRGWYHGSGSFDTQMVRRSKEDPPAMQASRLLTFGRAEHGHIPRGTVDLSSLLEAVRLGLRSEVEALRSGRHGKEPHICTLTTSS